MSDATAMARAWVWSALLGVALFSVYMANGREVGSEDTEANAMAVVTLLSGEGLRLDRFYEPALRNPRFRLPVNVILTHGHFRSLYSPGAPIVAAPFAAIPFFWSDRAQVGGETTVKQSYEESKRVSKFAAAVIAALIGVALDRVLRRLGLGAVSPPVVLSAGLGSTLWPVASQAMWQHGPAALMLITTVALLLPPALPPWRLLLAGVTTGALVACRLIDVVFAAAILGYVAWTRPNGLIWFLPGPMLIGWALVAYNLDYFGSIVGGQARLESLHPALHGVAGPWSGDIREGALGTLLSPGRGLFIYSPWIAIALGLSPMFWRALKPWPLLWWLLGALVLDLFLLSKYAVWWAGHSFGPRYWTDAMPLFAIVLAYALDWCRARSRRLLIVLTLAIVWSVAIHAVGALCFPSTWNLSPADVDTHHERLWHWLDCEVTRCLRESALWRGS